jgi:hypothetical protein
MKYLIIILVFIVLTFSCSKEEDNSNYPSTYTVTYYFKGVLKDTSNGNSVLDYRISTAYSYILCQDTISDSTYFLTHIYTVGKTPRGFKNFAVNLKDSSDNSIKGWQFTNPGWNDNDTIELDLNF